MLPAIAAWTVGSRNAAASPRICRLNSQGSTLPDGIDRQHQLEVDRHALPGRRPLAAPEQQGKDADHTPN